MRIEDHNDAALTAYALGELPPDEAAAVEARLETDAAAREQVEQIRATANLLERALATEDEPSHHQERRAMGWINSQRWINMAAAAAVVTGLGIGIVLMEQAPEPRLIAVGEMAQPAETANDAANRDVTAPQPMLVDDMAGEDHAAEDAPTQYEVARQEQRQLLEFRFNEAIEEANQAIAVGDFTAARAALQRMRTVRNTNPLIFESGELNAMDQRIRQLDHEINQRSALASQSHRQLDRATVEAQRRASSAGEEATSLAERRRREVELPAQQQGQTGGQVPAAVPASPGLIGGGGEPYFDAYGAKPAELPNQFHLYGRYAPPVDREAYDRIVDNDFLRPGESPLSTFSVDVDTASYANVRRFLNNGQLPPPDAVRIEELINYFRYDYEAPDVSADVPFAADIEVASAPWNPKHRLVRIGLQAADVDPAQRPEANLVFLVDVSGSMNSPDKLPLVQHGLRVLAEQLDGRDRVAIVAYAGSSGVVLPATAGDDSDAIRRAINSLQSGGSTNGAAGIQQAYDIARQNFREGGVNRVILATDGDFNVGITDRGQLTRLIEKEAKSGVFLTVLGFGQGNLQDATMEELSNRGDGFYAYIDSDREAERVLGERMLSTVQAVAKDVKIQVEFNPQQVAAYRLIGYANRLLEDRDFNDDTKDAGDVGAGHQVTAFYEIIPVGVPLPGEDAAEAIAPPIDELKYQQPAAPTTVPAGDDSGELMTVKLRWKAPSAAKAPGTSQRVAWTVTDGGISFDEADADLKFAASVAGFGMLLRDSAHRGDLTWEKLEAALRPYAEQLERARLDSEGARRLEFVNLVRQAAALAR